MAEYSVESGRIKTGFPGDILTVHALGSCVGVVMFNPISGLGGIAHIMLPGYCHENRRNVNRYTCNAITNLLKSLVLLPSERSNLRVCVIGGANVLKDPDAKIHLENISSVLNELEHLNLKPVHASLGGTERRKIIFEIGEGRVIYFIGDSKEKHEVKLSENILDKELR